MARSYLLIMFLLLQGFSNAQDSAVLSLDQAIAIAVQNNYEIEIALNNQDVSKYNRNVGNAGMLPSIGVTGTVNFATNSINQQFANGSSFQQSGVRANAYNVAAELNWTLFDGLKMFATYDRLTALKEQGEISTRMAVEKTVGEVMTAYYDVARQQRLIVSTEENIKIYEERLKIAEAKFAAGTVSEVDVLLAKIDLNTQKSNLINYNAAIIGFKTTLNRLMNREQSTDFMVDDSMTVVPVASLESLKSSMLAANNLLQYQETQIDVNKYLKREINSLRFPVLGLNTSYVFARSENQAGFSLFNQNLGFNVGFRASISIFDGWKVNTQYRAAKFAETNARLNYELQKDILEEELIQLYNNYQSSLQVITLEEESVSLAKSNVAISLERFRLAQGNSLEIQEAQRMLESTQLRLTDALYNAKTLETQVIQLTGGLVRSVE